MKKIFFFFLFTQMFLMKAQKSAKTLLFSDNSTDYGIVSQHENSVFEIKAADILQKYFLKVSGVPLEKSEQKFNIKLIDSGNKWDSEAFTIRNEGSNLILEGNKMGLVYAAYTFVEKFLGCRKYNPGEEAFCPQLKSLEVNLPINISEKPAFNFREVYSLAEADLEYRDWHKLHHLENFWGIWGHSFDKLVSVKSFKTHPEYFAFYKGKRHPTQLCLSNEEVFKIAVETLKKYFNENPDAKYWSVSPNDNSGFCECDLCKATDIKEGGNQGSLLKFVNRIAHYFPEKTFTTLAYNSTAKAPLNLKPEKNVIIFLSNIEVKRTENIENEPSAMDFRKNLEDWKVKTDRIFIWDYDVQFTNFLAPFPNYFTLKPNLEFYRKSGINGVFAQLSGPNYSDFAELKTYLLAKLLWNPDLDENDIIDDFLNGYYQKAAPFIKNLIEKQHFFAKESGVNLDIYGDPVNDYKNFLSPENLNILSNLLNSAEKEEAGNAKVIERIERLKLSIEYTVLQQAKFYGTDKFKILGLKSKKDFNAYLKNFVKNCEKNGITKLSEVGISPQEYLKQWPKK